MTRVIRSKRKPVPRAWREEHHRLTPGRARARGYGFRRTVRQRGKCSCGVEFPDSPGTDNLSPSALREVYNDHVAREYHGADYFTMLEVEG